MILQEIVLENYEVRRVMGETIASFYFPGEITILPNAITTVSLTSDVSTEGMRRIKCFFMK